ncbi:TIGR03826 family flagellar region protein [Paenibacillus sp. GXUN7292]|uniref:TIGR03826 family flagellar region protein n=1 Tax=Paenibacillus sp. GXUN7292 TaxID=3422499 RepID=UPI003D7C708C
MSLENCPRCGKLFAKNFRDVCPVCIREIDKEYERCAEYLREFRGAMITELSDQTGVSIRQITKFIREGRISLMDAPNMTYPCESCGTMIRDNNLCDPCRKRLLRDTSDMQHLDAKKQEYFKEQHQKQAGSYLGLEQYKNRH